VKALLLVLMVGGSASADPFEGIRGMFEADFGARLALGASGIPQEGFAPAAFDAGFDVGKVTGRSHALLFGGRIDKYVNGGNDANTVLANAHVGLLTLGDDFLHQHWFLVGLRHLNDVYVDDMSTIGSGGGPFAAYRYRYGTEGFSVMAEVQASTYLYGLDGKRTFGVMSRVRAVFGSFGIETYVHLDPVTKLEVGFGLAAAPGFNW
jgi:hypothetical protein